MFLRQVDLDANIPDFYHARLFRNVRIQNEPYDGPNGFNWDIEEWPYLVQRTQGSKITINARIGQIQLRIDKTGTDTYVVQHSQKDQYTFTHDAGSGRFILTRRSNGGIETIEFLDFAQSPPGLFKTRTDAMGRTTSVPDSGGYRVDGNINSLVTTRGAATYELVYEYHSSGSHSGRLSSVTLRRSDTSTDLRRTRYEYYVYPNSFGSTNDLKAATLQKYVGGGDPWKDIATHYYRYYTNELDHLVKYVVNPATYADIVALAAR